MTREHKLRGGFLSLRGSNTFMFLFLTLVILMATPLLLAQDASQTTIDYRVWNMAYWMKLAEQGLVEVAKDVVVPPAMNTGIDAPDSPDVLITSATNTTQSENSVFVNPLDNNKVLNSNNSTNWPFSTLFGTSGFFTADGGATWGGSTAGTGGSNGGDPAAAIGTTGTYYVGGLNTSYSQTLVARSTNEGSTWTRSFFGSGFPDKNHLWPDNGPASPFEGNVYVAYSQFSSPYGAAQFARSTNDGVSWTITATNLSAGVTAGSHNQGVVIQTGPAGEVYVAWAVYDAFSSGNYDEDDIGWAKSTDGGATFSAATRITTPLVSDLRGIHGEGSNLGGSWPVRLASFPTMAADISGMTNNIYIVFTNIGVPGVNTGLAWDNYLLRSTDGGTTWSLLPDPVGDDAAGTRRHYYPWITCDPITGNLSCIYYTNRSATSVTSTLCEVWVSNSCDGGDTWTDNKISDVNFTPAPIPGLAGGYMGDYIGVSARDNKVYPVWSDNRALPVRAYTSPFTFDLCGGGGGIPCSDITSMAARCIGGGTKTIQVRVNLLDNIIHAGEMVTITIDGTPFTATIVTNGTHSRANFSVDGWSVGDHVVSLVDPPGCLADVHAACAAGDGIAKADPYWDDDAAWTTPAQNAPQATKLLGNYPNPFNPSTSISYALREDGFVTLKIYNTLGEEVATLVNEFQVAGNRSATWNGRNNEGSPVASGIYIYRLTAGNVVKSDKMMLMK